MASNVLTRHDLDQRGTVEKVDSPVDLPGIAVPELDVPKLDNAKTRILLESALAYAGGTHTVADVLDAISSGDAQLWSGPNSCVVTEIDRQRHPHHASSE